MATATQPIYPVHVPARVPAPVSRPVSTTVPAPAPLPSPPRATPRARGLPAHDVLATVGAALCVVVLLTALVVLAAFMADLAAGALVETMARLVAATRA